MKHASFFNVIALGVVLAIGPTGCAKSPKNPTPIPGKMPKSVSNDAGPGNPIIPGGGDNTSPGKTVPPTDNPSAKPVDQPKETTGGIPIVGDWNGRPMDTNYFKADTIYFEFDKAAIRPSERSKIEAVVSDLKSNPANAVLVEGHCDERGTEEYNRALGERRALAVREYIIHSGIGAERVFTISYGLDRPAVDGHNEEAWSKNRRAQFDLLLPKPGQ